MDQYESARWGGGRSLLGQFSRQSADIQERILRADAATPGAKSLRAFSPAEVARFLDLKERDLRDLLKARPVLPALGAPGSDRQGLSLAEVNIIRNSMFGETHKRKWLPQRRAGDEKLQVISVANFKGGAAKTTTAVHLAQYLALRGYRALLVDLDSQASLTALFGYQPDRDIGEDQTLYPVTRGEKRLSEVIRPTYWPGVDLVPANLRLYNFEFEVPVRLRHERTWQFWQVLDNAIAEVSDRYDVAICDCPPSLGYLSMNGIYAATGLLVPTPPSMLDFTSTGAFFGMVEATMADLDDLQAHPKSFDFIRVLPSRVDPTDRNQRVVLQLMEHNYGRWLMRNHMVATTALDRAGNAKLSYYEAGYTDGSRAAYMRGLDHLDAVNREIEELLSAVWRRNAPAQHPSQHSAETADDATQEH